MGFLSPPWQVPLMSDKIFSRSLTCSRKTLAQCLSDPYLESDSQRVGKSPGFDGDKRVGMNEHYLVVVSNIFYFHPYLGR